LIRLLFDASKEEKKFIYPSAFGSFLESENKFFLKQIEEDKNVIIWREAESKRINEDREKIKAAITIESRNDGVRRLNTHTVKTSDRNNIDIAMLKDNIIRKYWLAVHDVIAYNENPRLFGFKDTVNKAKSIKPGDIIVYYLSGSSTIKGIYEVCDKPWKRDDRWVSEHQIQISPILELKGSIDFKVLVPNLQIFKGLIRWSGAIQGKNAVRELNKTDFKIIEDSVYKACSNTK
jgi:predicted RNA-binding protein